MPSSMAVPAGEGEMEPITGENTKRVCYFFDSDIGNYHYGPGHPMKPTRIRMTHSLVMNYGLYKKMEIFRAKPATKREMSQFHTDEYVDFLYRITPENAQTYIKEQSKYNVGDDCPVFDGLFEYCSISAGGSMEGAARLSRDKCDIAVNWAGGLHHAKKAEASGFCYVNDIVLGILELLRYHARVLYIDIDVHHGDGVEEAFYTTDRVMTVSLHKYGEFFPGTGASRDIGIGKGKGYAVNVPLRDGVTDECYQDIFQSVVGRCVEWYQPGAIVLQCGADSLAGDKIGCFNMSMQGHASCVEFVKRFNLPLLLLGGGGYTIKAVSRAWAYETGLAAGQKLGKEIPSNEYYEYFGPDYQLDVRANNMEDMNTPEFMHKIKSLIFDQLRDKTAAPGVQGHAIPKLAHDDDDDDMDSIDSDERLSKKYLDSHIQHQTELSDSEDEGLGGRKHRQSHGPEGAAKRRRTPVNGDLIGGGRKSTTPSVIPQGGLGGQAKGTRSRTRSPVLGGTASTSASGTPAPQLIGVTPVSAGTTQPPPPSGTVVSTGAIVPTSALESNGNGVENAIAGPSTLPSVSTTTTNGSPSTAPPVTATVTTAATSTTTSPPTEAPTPSVLAPSFSTTTFPPPPPPNTTTDTPIPLLPNFTSNPVVGPSASNANPTSSFSTNAYPTTTATPIDDNPAPVSNALDPDAMDVDVDAVVADLEEGIRTGRIDREIRGNGSDFGVDVEMNDGLEAAPTASEPQYPPPQPQSSEETTVQLATATTQPSQPEPVKPVFSNHSIMPMNVSMDDDLPPSTPGGPSGQSGQSEGR